MPEIRDDLDSARRDARDALLRYDQLLSTETEESREALESQLIAAGLSDDARRLISSRDADLREAGLYLVALLPPESQAHLFSAVGLNRDAKRAFARFVDAERFLVVKVLRDSEVRIDARSEEGPGSLLELESLIMAFRKRREWETRLFEALDDGSKFELNELLGEFDPPLGNLRSRDDR